MKTKNSGTRSVSELDAVQSDAIVGGAPDAIEYKEGGNA
jgi:hypothetical protein